MINLEDLARRLDLVIPSMERISTGFERLLKSVTVPELPNKQELVSGGTQTYAIKTFDLTTARTNEEISVEGTFLHAWTDGYLNGIGVRFNQVENDLAYFVERNPYPGPFYRIFLTNTAQAGKTLKLFIGKMAMMEGFTNLSSVYNPSYFFNVVNWWTYWIGAIEQYHTEDANLAGLVTNQIRITGVRIRSAQNLKYRLIFYAADTFFYWDVLGEVVLDLPTYGYQINDGGWFFMDLSGLSLDYIDRDGSNELHAQLQCLSLEGKRPYTNAALQGAVYDDGGVLTDQTAEANSAAANDMTLLPVLPVVNDAYYFGSYGVPGGLALNMGVQGAGNWTITWEFYDNTDTWVPFTTMPTDTILGFTAAAGLRYITFTGQNWKRTTINGVYAFWFRARVSAFVNIVTRPLGTQAWINMEDLQIDFTYEPKI